MVTATEQADDLPTHDAFGTDLARVREMLALGYGEHMIAEALCITTKHARYAIIVATDDRQGAPSEDEIEALCVEIQTGWTEEMAVAARYGDRRASSRVAVPENLTPEEHASRVRVGKRKAVVDRAADGTVNVKYLEGIASDLKWWSRPTYRDQRASRCFRTHEEAVEFGRQWMKRQAEIDAMSASNTPSEETTDGQHDGSKRGRCGGGGCYRGDARRVRKARSKASCGG
jgi:hypothetical protein